MQNRPFRVVKINPTTVNQDKQAATLLGVYLQHQAQQNEYFTPFKGAQFTPFPQLAPESVAYQQLKTQSAHDVTDLQFTAPILRGIDIWGQTAWFVINRSFGTQIGGFGRIIRLLGVLTLQPDLSARFQACNLAMKEQPLQVDKNGEVETRAALIERVQHEADLARRDLANHISGPVFYELNGKQQSAIFMQFHPGETLNEFMQDPQNNLTLSIDSRLALCRSIKETALQMHQLQIIHRDVKATNVLLNRIDRTAKIIDFGCACDSENVDTRIGNLLYAPSEFFHGEPLTVESDNRGFAWLEHVLLGGNDLPNECCITDNRHHHAHKLMHQSVDFADYWALYAAQDLTKVQRDTLLRAMNRYAAAEQAERLDDQAALLVLDRLIAERYLHEKNLCLAEASTLLPIMHKGIQLRHLLLDLGTLPLYLQRDLALTIINLFEAAMHAIPDDQLNYFMVALHIPLFAKCETKTSSIKKLNALFEDYTARFQSIAELYDQVITAYTQNHDPIKKKLLLTLQSQLLLLVKREILYPLSLVNLDKMNNEYQVYHAEFSQKLTDLMSDNPVVSICKNNCTLFQVHQSLARQIPHYFSTPSKPIRWVGK